MNSKRFWEWLKSFQVPCIFVLIAFAVIVSLTTLCHKNPSDSRSFTVYINFQNETSDYMEFSQVDETDSHFQVNPAGENSSTQLDRIAINGQTKLYIFRQELRYDDQTFSILNNTFNLYITAENNRIILAEIVKDTTFHANYTFTAEIVDDTTVEITISK